MKKRIFILVLAAILTTLFSCKKSGANNTNFPLGKDSRIVGKWKAIKFILNNQEMDFPAEIIYTYKFSSNNEFKLFAKSGGNAAQHALGKFNAVSSVDL